MTDATVTSAPNLVNVSVMHVVSISSDPSAMGTKTFLDMARFVVVEAGLVEEDVKVRVVTRKEAGTKAEEKEEEGVRLTKRAAMERMARPLVVR